MKTLKVDPENIGKIIKKAMKLIKQGKVLVCPTDTVYGLVCDATNKKAVERLFRIKKRSLKKPVPIFVKDINMAKKLAYIDKKQEKFLKKAWPGKITAVLRRTRLRRSVAKAMERRRQGFGGRGKRYKLYGVDKNTIGLRIPKYKVISYLLSITGLPLTGTSANIAGRQASTKIKEVIKQFENKKYQPDLIIDIGNLPKSKPSKVIDLTGEKMIVLRR